MPSHHQIKLFQQQDNIQVSQYAPSTDLPPPGACNSPPRKATPLAATTTHLDPPTRFTTS
ncbi:hypothetical protein PISMIDRAFT_9871 [Pisolithus microcarpus 441]|uniref:Uncharacterized protein n=1 Tax=Pisolithus microcarpus 441 TaxID=765257 RepID=A0A0C9ZZA3_9AGAM|nr:hypothetical protein PISMIDRAFT_9871 [Pisolithus microcarpus 441]